jgi:alginate O-acetyltransferase complex protein AlgI
MAVGLAGLLGYRLCLNFDGPYLARDIRDLWRRWHISLTDWFRDYLYVPLCGSDRAGARWAFALVATMAVCGLWHGATWNFVLFGTLNGLALLAFALWQRAKARLDPSLARSLEMPRVLATPLTVATFAIAGVPFRSNDLADSVVLWRSMLAWDASGALALPAEIGWLLVGLALLHAICHSRQLGIWWRRVPDWQFGFVYGAAWALALSLRAVGYEPFIYLRF